MPKLPLRPYWATTDRCTVRLYQGDVLRTLQRMPVGSVQCVMTSPPYYGLRDYGTDKTMEIGSEFTPEEYLDRMVAVFREVRRVLRDDGTVWINMGDSYSSSGVSGPLSEKSVKPATDKHRRIELGRAPSGGLKGGNLLGMPWRLALTLQADGWMLRQDIIWHKPSPMPESVRNRCTKAHEYVFLLAKRMGYFYDAEAVKAACTPGTCTTNDSKAGSYGQAVAVGSKPTGNAVPGTTWQWGSKANRRSVWTVASEGYPGAHFATFPKRLVEPCILAGTSTYGCCVECGAPWRRKVKDVDDGIRGQGWQPTCKCGTQRVKPCTVLDPFCGSGTVMCVALEHGRYSVGIDLSEQYLRNNAIPRIEGELLSRPALAWLLGGEKTERFSSGRSLLDRRAY